jgi:MYXO-CTERM domain-containing protein
MGACSAAEPQEPESVGVKAEAITAACNLDTIGLPCDPDGPAGAKLECEGNCGIATNGLVACIAVVAGVLDGVVCGTTNGVGDAACNRYCSGKTCLAADAPAGAACRPSSKSNPCEGQCDGAGKCDKVAGIACDFGRDEQLCKFATCDFANSKQCVTKNLRKNTLCSDTDACSIGLCSSAGVCVAGSVIGCNDGNACTDDSCDPNDGGCVGLKDDTNTCSDGNACFTGEHCLDGGCVPGTLPVDCDDKNACTADSCDPNTGCAHVAQSCSDNDACTQDVCDPSDGSCSHPAVTCVDNDACTTDSCSTAAGCVFTPIDCNDNDACTVDSCGAGDCSHAPVACDDNDACTADSCDTVSGCAHTLIPGCGGAGAGGEGGTAGGGSEAGAGGAEPEPGAAGEAGAPTGAAGEGSGAAGAGAGASGSAGSATAGTESGGASSTSGSSAGGVSVAGNGGSGAGADDPARSNHSSGCGCRVAGAPTPARGAIWGALFAGLTAILRRRREVKRR